MKSDDDSKGYPDFLAETIGLYVLYSGIPEFPKGFVKSDPPDWHIQSSIGLEMVRAFNPVDLEQVINTPLVSFCLKDIVSMNLKYDGQVYFHSSSIDDCPIIMYDIQSRIISYGNPPKSCHYDNLEPSIRERLGECHLYCHHSGLNELDNPCQYLQLVKQAFQIKFSKLNTAGRQSFDHEWLFIEVFSQSDLRYLEELFEWMTDYQKDCKKKFDRIFIFFSGQGDIFHRSQYTLVSYELSERAYSI